jgi:hypothetical protein
MKDPIYIPISENFRIKFVMCGSVDGNYNIYTERLVQRYGHPGEKEWMVYNAIFIPPQDMKGFISAISRLEKILLLQE